MIRTCRRIPRYPNGRPKRAGQPVTVEDLQMAHNRDVNAALSGRPRKGGGQ
jgi:hypothetical protein